MDEVDGILFIAMEYVEGHVLSDEIRRGPIPVERALDFAVQIAAGLDKAHSENIVHHDIKASNIVVTKDDTIKILDFGLARSIKQVDRLHVSGTAEREEVDARTDIFSLAVVLHEMLRRQTPFRGNNLTQMMLSILNDQPEPLSQVATKVPASLDPIIAKGLAKSRESRYKKIKEFQQDLLKLKEPPKKSGEMQQAGSVAVLYFDNLSGASDQEYLGVKY